MTPHRHCLVVSPNWVGDTLMALPVVEALAASGRSLRVLAKPHLHCLLRLVPGVDQTLERRASDRETIALLQAAELDEAVVLPNSFRSAWLPYRAGVPVRWGYRRPFRTPLLSPAVSFPTRDRHQVEDYAELLAAMNVAPPASWRPRLPLSRETLERGAALLQRATAETGAEKHRSRHGSGDFYHQCRFFVIFDFHVIGLNR